MKPVYFDHEKLHVYQKAIQFVSWTEDLLQEVQRKAAVRDQIDRASTSVVLNIAEGNGKLIGPERRKFLLTARGSTVECAACLDVFVAKRLVGMERVWPGKELLYDIVRMLSGLIASIETHVREEEAEYHISDDEYSDENMNI